MIQDTFWSQFSGCNCIRHFLMECAFDNEYALKCINDAVIETIQNHINQNRHILQGIECCHKTIYSNQKTFKLLPGHILFLKSLPDEIKSIALVNNIQPSIQHNLNSKNPAYSSVLNEMTRCAIENFNEDESYPRRPQFSKTLTNFSVYQYLIGGKACYKFLAENLPIPRATSIGKLNY